MFIRLFGSPAIIVDNQIIDIKRKKARALIYYLAAKNHPVSRQEVISILWPQFDRIIALKNLSTYVHNIRSILPQLIIVDKEYLSISKHVTVDVHEFDKLTLQHDFEIENNKIVDELYQGDFLKHFHIEDSEEYEVWKDNQSEHYQNQIINFKYTVAEAYVKKGDIHQALEILNQILKWDPYREDVYKLAMEANCRAGNRPGAIKLYEQLNNLLKEEFGISPMADTVKLYSELIMEDIKVSQKEFRDAKGYSKIIERTEKLTIEDIMPKLSDSTKVMLQILSICAEKFDFKILALVLGVEEKAVFKMLDELRTNRVLTIAADNSIVFLNQKEKDYVYASISPPQRKYLHFRIAKAIEETYQMSYENAQAILFHYQQSGENKQILKAAMQVGEMAHERGDFQRAIHCYEQACNYLHGRDQMELIEYISQMMLIMGDAQAARKLLIENADKAGKDFQLGIESCFKMQAKLIELPEYLESIWGGILPQYPIEIEKEFASDLWIGEHYLQNEVENLNFYIMFLHCKASYYEMQMRFDEARECYRKVLTLSKDDTNAWFVNYIGNCYMKLGMYETNQEKAEEYLSMGIAYAGEKKNRRSLPLLLIAISEYDIRHGRLEVAKKNLDWAESLDKKYKNPYINRAIMLGKARLELAKDNKRIAEDILKQLLKLTTQNNTRYMRAVVNKLLTEI